MDDKALPLYTERTPYGTDTRWRDRRAMVSYPTPFDPRQPEGRCMLQINFEASKEDCASLAHLVYELIRTAEQIDLTDKNIQLRNALRRVLDDASKALASGT